MADGLAQHAGDDAVRGPLHQLQRKRAADAIAEEELADAEVVHRPHLIVGKTLRNTQARHQIGRL